jgi:hypothetical protein
MRCTCGKPGTISLKRRDFPYCEECFRHTIIKLFRHEAGDGPLYVRPGVTAHDRYYREALEALARDARRDVIEDDNGMTPGCAERAAAAATTFLLGARDKQEQIIPATITREELERFFKPAPQEIEDPIERDLRLLEERYPGTLASVLKSANDRDGKLQ